MVNGQSRMKEDEHEDVDNLHPRDRTGEYRCTPRRGIHDMAVAIGDGGSVSVGAACGNGSGACRVLQLAREP